MPRAGRPLRAGRALPTPLPGGPATGYSLGAGAEARGSYRGAAKGDPETCIGPPRFHLPSVVELPLRNQRLLYGFPRPVGIETLRARLDCSDVAGLREVCRSIRARLRDGAAAPGDAVLTDDWAPIEQLTDQMMKRRPP